MTLNVGVIGTGAMGAYHARALATQVAAVRVAALADPDTDSAEEVARSLAPAGVRVLGEAEALIADPGVEAVVIASPDDTHEELVLARVDAGKPVLCEKPLASTVQGRSVEVTLPERPRLYHS